MSDDRLQLERSICAAILSDLSEGPEGTATRSNLVARLDPSDFRNDECRAIYVASRAIHLRGQKPDEVLVHNEDRKLAIKSLASLAAQCVTIANVGAHCDTLIKMSMRSKIERWLGEVAGELRDEDPGEVLGRLVAKSLDLIDSGSKSSPFGEASDTFSSVVQSMIKERHEGVTGQISTGFEVCDRFLRGLFPQRMYLIAARPSMGKSALAGAMALNAAKQGKQVALFSNEMPAIDIFARMLAAESGVNINNYLSGMDSNDEEGRLLRAADKLSRVSGLRIFDDPGMDIKAIAAACLHCRATGGLDMVVLDYVQMIPCDKKLSREQGVAEISRELKRIARQMRIPVVACCQLNRGSEARQDKRPMLSDLRDTGQLEQDGDVIMLLYREAYYNREKENNRLDVDIAKNRHGQTGMVYLSWDPNRTKVAD